MEEIEHTRIKVSKLTDAKYKSKLGQFLTPEPIAKFMASLFPITESNECKLLDAGAGIGSLSNAFFDRCQRKELKFKKIFLSAFEIDTSLCLELEKNLKKNFSDIEYCYEVRNENYIESSVNSIKFKSPQDYSHAILNPPYLKINSLSQNRLLLRDVGIETVNLYSAFVALSILLMKEGGHVVAIIPRSFCNGPYYKPFRKFILQKCAIRHIHLFDSRSSAFKDDGVLQENVILHLEVGRVQTDVKVSKSTDERFEDYAEQIYSFKTIVNSYDLESFIHIPTPGKDERVSSISFAHYELNEIGISVSTGPVVDFRLKNHLRAMPEKGSSPLLYPAHFTNCKIEWPKLDIKKPNAIMYNSETAKWFYPNGFYCVVRRFSSKEEKRRIVACVVEPNCFKNEKFIGFENHLNVLHSNKQGLQEELAKGLALYLNTTVVDTYFRMFSGHTQVNAADLKLIKYPSREALIELGKNYNKVADDQNMIDEIVKKVCG